MSPQEVCVSLKLCSPENKSKSNSEIKIVAVPQDDVEGKQSCALCEYILHYIQTLITDPKIEVAQSFNLLYVFHYLTFINHIHYFY